MYVPALGSSTYGSLCPFSVPCYLLSPDLCSYRSCCSQGLCNASSRSSSSTFAPARSFVCSCSESPWPGRFFLHSCSSHLCFLPWLPPVSFVSILFLCPFSIIPLCSEMLFLFFSLERYWPSLSVCNELLCVFMYKLSLCGFSSCICGATTSSFGHIHLF